MARRLRCPRCSTTVTVEQGEKPSCPKCGFGGPGDAAGGPKPGGAAPSVAPTRPAPAPPKHAAPPESAPEPEPEPEPEPQPDPELEEPRQPEPDRVPEPPSLPDTHARASGAEAPADEQLPETSEAHANGLAERPVATGQPLKPAGAVSFGSNQVPDVTLFAGEALVTQHEANARDLGLVRKLIGHKAEMVITNRRALGYEATRTTAELGVIDLKKVSGVALGGRFLMQVFMGGVGLLVLAGIIASIPFILSSFLGEIGFMTFLLPLIFAFVAGGLGLVLIAQARQRVISIHASGMTIEAPVHRVHDDAVRGIMEAVEQGARL